MSSGLGQLPLLPTLSYEEDSSLARARWQRRARLLAWGGLAWHFVEFAIALGAGLAASSIALIGFGFDSLIESAAGFIVMWAARRFALIGERAFALQLALTFSGLFAAESLLVGPAPQLAGLRVDKWAEVVTIFGAAARQRMSYTARRSESWWATRC